MELLDILTDNRGYKKEFPINNAFNYLNNSEIICIKYKSNIFCQLCNLNNVEEVFYNPLISIKLEDITRHNLIEIIFTKFNGHESSCETCSFTIDERIRKERKYHICKKTNFFDLKFPPILCFIFNLSDDNDKDSSQFYNLQALRKDYEHLVVEKFNIGELNYILKGSINQSSINHYTSTLLNIEDKSLDILNDEVYYYDGMKNNHCLIKLNIHDKKLRIKKLLDENLLF